MKIAKAFHRSDGMNKIQPRKYESIRWNSRKSARKAHETLHIDKNNTNSIVIFAELPEEDTKREARGGRLKKRSRIIFSLLIRSLHQAALHRPIAPTRKSPAATNIIITSMRRYYTIK